MKVEILSPPVSPEDLSRLSSLLAECVHAGASIGFVEPLADGEVEVYWRKVVNETAQGNSVS